MSQKSRDAENDLPLHHIEDTQFEFTQSKCKQKANPAPSASDTEAQSSTSCEAQLVLLDALCQHISHSPLQVAQHAVWHFSLQKVRGDEDSTFLMLSPSLKGNIHCAFWKRQVWCSTFVLQRKGQLVISHKTPDKFHVTLLLEIFFSVLFIF